VGVEEGEKGLSVLPGIGQALHGCICDCERGQDKALLVGVVLRQVQGIPQTGDGGIAPLTGLADDDFGLELQHSAPLDGRHRPAEGIVAGGLGLRELTFFDQAVA